MSIERLTPQTSHYSLLASADELGLELGADVSARVAAMTLVAARESRDSIREARQGEEALLVAQQRARIEELHEQARCARDAALERALGQFAQGACQISGALELGGSLPGEGGWKGIGNAAQAGLNAFAAASDFKAAEASTAAVHAENLTRESERRLADLKIAAEEARDLARAALDSYRNLSQTETAAKQAAIRVRG